MNKAILSVYYGLGLRRSEGISLDIDDVQISNGVVYIRKGKNNKERYVPLNVSIQKDIELHISGVRKSVLNYKKQKGTKALFISERGKRITGNVKLIRNVATQLQPSKTKKSQALLNSLIITVGRAGIEPATSCLSSKRSEPTELTSRNNNDKNNKI